jgi:hypothetical protein
MTGKIIHSAWHYKREHVYKPQPGLRIRIIVGRWIRIRIRVKSRIRIKVKNKEVLDAQNRAMVAWRLTWTLEGLHSEEQLSQIPKKSWPRILIRK